jgi:hypothetical protein
MDLITKLAKGLAAAKAAVGSEQLSAPRSLQLEAGGSLSLQARRKRESGMRVVRIETPIAEGLARIDLTPADARALASALTDYADMAADDAKLVTTHSKD